jgi:hypothetical protein
LVRGLYHARHSVGAPLDHAEHNRLVIAVDRKVMAAINVSSVS